MCVVLKENCSQNQIEKASGMNALGKPENSFKILNTTVVFVF